MSYGYYYSQPPASPVRARSPWLWLGPLLALFAVLMFIGSGVVYRFFTTPDLDGVRAGNQLAASTLADLDRKKLVEPGERILAFYEVAASGDGSELALVTSSRLVYYKDGRTTAMALEDIASVKHHEETLIGDVIEARSNDGEIIRVEVAPLNGGDVFLSTLEDARRNRANER
jgi:hypothetical protein